MSPSPANNPQGGTHRYQSGVGLIEVLVAALVLAVGILGIAALQARALTGSGNSMGRSMATIASYSIIDALSSDSGDAIAGVYNGTVAANACAAASSTLASVVLNAWCQSLAANLGAAPTTQGTVACATSGACAVTIQWNDSRTAANAGGGTQTLATHFQLPTNGT